MKKTNNTSSTHSTNKYECQTRIIAWTALCVGLLSLLIVLPSILRNRGSRNNNRVIKQRDINQKQVVPNVEGQNEPDVNFLNRGDIRQEPAVRNYKVQPTERTPVGTNPPLNNYRDNAGVNAFEGFEGVNALPTNNVQPTERTPVGTNPPLLNNPNEYRNNLDINAVEGFKTAPAERNITVPNTGRTIYDQNPPVLDHSDSYRSGDLE